MYEAHSMGGMGYRLLRPENFNPDIKYPVVITLHNAGGMGSPGGKNYNIKNLRFVNQQFASSELRLAYPAYILCPQVNAAFSKQHLDICKAIIAGLPSVEMSRIYVMGQSMGGEGAYTFIAADPDYFAAAIAASGFGELIKAPAVLKYFDLWALHGVEDSTVPYEKDLAFFEAVKSLGGRMKFTSFVKAGNSTEKWIIGDYPMTNILILSSGRRHTTQAAGPGFDPEPNTLKWLFSKRKNSSELSVGANTVP